MNRLIIVSIFGTLFYVASLAGFALLENKIIGHSIPEAGKIIDEALWLVAILFPFVFISILSRKFYSALAKKVKLLIFILAATASVSFFFLAVYMVRASKYFEFYFLFTMSIMVCFAIIVGLFYILESKKILRIR